MKLAEFSAEPVLSTLKDFQRKTVDYVFARLYGDRTGRADRFLVADEVGLGKTLVARGLIAKTVEHLRKKHVKRIDVIYVCSNAAIARQNINRLSVVSSKKFTFSTRLTLLPKDIHSLRSNPVNFVSFTPGTTFDLRSRGGVVEERVIICRMLARYAFGRRKGFLRMLQATVRREEDWLRRISEFALPLDPEITAEFRKRVYSNSALRTRIEQCSRAFERRARVEYALSSRRYAIIGELRELLAEAALRALEPDLIILDEFQRFKNLLHGNDDSALLAKKLFEFRPEGGKEWVKLLLLSATPYKMLSLDHEADDDHYRDFLETLRFLAGDAEAASISADLRDYRQGLLSFGGMSAAGLSGAARRVRQRLLRYMCRTERVSITEDLNAMLGERLPAAVPEAEDLPHALIADRFARAVGASDIVEYWKSAPYLLNFLRGYDAYRRLEKQANNPSTELIASVRAGESCMIRQSMIESYQELSPANPRLRVLYEHSIERGLWRLLWLPPSMPYVTPEGPYGDVGDVSKILVFSSWNLVPDALATLSSYEAERRMIDAYGLRFRHSELHEKVSPRLVFTQSYGRLTGMPVLALLLPSPTLVRMVDPLAVVIRHGQGTTITSATLLERTQAMCDELLATLPRPGGRPDEANWYGGALGLLEVGSPYLSWLTGGNPLGGDGNDGVEPAAEGFQDHLKELRKAVEIPGRLGARPADLSRILALIAVAGPGTCALRSLMRVAPGIDPHDTELLSGALRIAWGLRSLFNLPDTIALLRGSDQDPDSYWRLVLQYCLEGNLQSLLDEQVHVLREVLGLHGLEPTKIVRDVSTALAESLSIRSAPVTFGELSVQAGRIRRERSRIRCRFALRFGELRGDLREPVARAEIVRQAFNSPFRPFVLATTSIGQEGLDFHTWCHQVMHWNLPANPVDLEQREGRVHRYKGHAVRKNIVQRYGLPSLLGWDGHGDPWAFMFDRAAVDRPRGASDLVPYWVFEGGDARVERIVPIIPFSREQSHFQRLKKNLALYRLVFGQPRQEDLLSYLTETMDEEQIRRAGAEWRIDLSPPVGPSARSL